MLKDNKYYCDYCGKEIVGRCKKHLQRVKKHFCTREHRVLFTMNKVEYRDDYVVIFVEHKGEQHECLVDVNDYEKKIKPLGTKIFMYGNNYCYFSLCTKENPRKKIKLHRYLMNVVDKEDVVIDHINRNRLDNRKCNLRKSNTVLNTYNRDYSSNSTSKVKGVSFNKAMQKWRGQVQVNGKRIYTEPYKSFETCVEVTEELRKQMYKEYRKTLKDSIKKKW